MVQHNFPIWGGIDAPYSRAVIRFQVVANFGFGLVCCSPSYLIKVFFILCKLFNWTTQNITFQFDNKFYKQTDGLAMGSPIVPLMADVIMNHIINQAINLTPLLYHLSFFFRFVDGCFATFPDPFSRPIIHLTHHDTRCVWKETGQCS